MKHLLTAILAIFSFISLSFSQNRNIYNYKLSNSILKTDYQYFIGNMKYDFSITLKNILSLNHVNTISFNLIDEVKSLTGSHLTFQVMYTHIPIEDCTVKVHVDKNETAYQITHNIPKDIAEKLDALLSPSPTISDFSFDKKNNTIYEQKIVLISSENEALLFALKTTFFSEQNSNYKEQFSTLENLIYENDLKVFSDSTITGKVFLPDPLTTSGNTYGGAYVDGFSKDTLALVIKSIENIGQNPINTGTVNFTFFGQTFSVDAQSYTNSFTSDSVYSIFRTLYWMVIIR